MVTSPSSFSLLSEHQLLNEELLSQPAAARILPRRRSGEIQAQKQFDFLEKHPVIRRLSDYSLESLSQFRQDRH